jgi:translation initiation factor IF-2
VLLVADVEELKADATVPARGLIIEAHMENGRGPIAHALIEEGTLKPGYFIVAGGAYAKVRNLDATDGKPLKEAGPSTPVVISGFKTLPEFGDAFTVVKDEKIARTQAAQTATERANAVGQSNMSSSELLRIISRSDQLSELPILIKADVQGSLTSVADSLKSVETEEVAVRIVGSGVGVINENDIHMANSSQAIIYGFNTSVANNIKRLASRDNVSIRLYNVIYELIDDVKTELSKLLADEVVEKDMGKLEVKGIFKTTKTEIIAGGEVLEGTLKVPAFARIFRKKEQIGEAELTGLKRGPNDAKDLATSELGGISLKTTSRIELELGDRIEFYTREIQERTL